MNNRMSESVVLGGGLTGLSAAYVLTNAGFKVSVFEGDVSVGGLSRTICKNGYRFDLGGHRFFTKDRKIDSFVKKLMGGELLTVRRSSKIILRDKYFDYPLRPVNAVFGFGIPVITKIAADYGIEKLRGLFKQKDYVSLEDWVVGNFGRTLFDIYFREYSEKVWGIKCSEISAEWVDRRIQGLSLAKAVKEAIFRAGGKEIPTLVDSFFYPKLGIGRIADRLKEEIEKRNRVFTESRITGIRHSGAMIRDVMVEKNDRAMQVEADEFISSIPLNKLVLMMDPAPPDDVMDAARSLRFRDIIIVAIMVDRKRVTDQTWIYVPEKKIPFGRIHEPTNWSDSMAPEGKSLLVMEYFSTRGDNIWNMTDESLVDTTVANLEKMDVINRCEVNDSSVIRVTKAYPLFEVGYKRHAKRITDYLGAFGNLHLSGRCGMFQYYNMDHAIESGIRSAEAIVAGAGLISEEDGSRIELAESR